MFMVQGNKIIILFLSILLLCSVMGSIFLISLVLRRKKRREAGEVAWCEGQNKKKGRDTFLLVFLLIFGLIFCSIGTIPTVALWNKTKDWVEVPAVLSEVEIWRSHTKRIAMSAKVTYEYEGKRYEDVSLDYKSTTMKEGEKVKISVNPLQPEQMEYNVKGQIAFFLIFLVVGAAFVFLSIYLWIRRHFGKTGEAQEQEAATGEKSTQKPWLFIGLVVLGMYTIFFFTMPFPLFLFMFFWFLGSFLFVKLRKRFPKDKDK